jgi:iron complex outermembrane receptor protein
MSNVTAQPCAYKLSGSLHCHNKYCSSTSGVEILIRETNQQTFTDENGNFHIQNICAGAYHLHIHGLGFQIIDTTIRIDKDIQLLIELNPNTHLLRSVIISDKQSKNQYMSSASQIGLSADEIKSLRGLSFADALQTLSGLQVLRSGPNIAKPVLHGMHSNRLLLLNNGSRLEGQNWGNEHAPEIDLNSAGSIEVIKGAASLRYGSDAIAGVIEVLPAPFDTTKTWSGFIALHGFTNGMGGSGSGSLDYFKKTKKISSSLRLQSSYTRHGSFNAPDYIIGNTASRQFNQSIHYQVVRKGLQAELSWNRFNSRPGILASSHIGNLNDLNEALNHNKPTVNYPFTYAIKRPYQDIIHQTFQGKLTYALKTKSHIVLQYAHQDNNRKEYDAQTPFSDSLERGAVADLNFLLITDQLQSRWILQHEKHSSEIGLALGTQGQGFRGTGYRSLVPNFRSYDLGAYSIQAIHIKQLTIDAGARYDYKTINTFQRNPISLKIDERNMEFHAWSFNIGSKLVTNHHCTLKANLGRAWRVPQVIELFARGIHQGAASYELGDSSLNTEKALSATIDLNYDYHILHVHTTIYHQYISNYIYLRPMLYNIQLIQGAFPVFAYQQTDMIFTGADIDVSFSWSKLLSSSHQFSYLYSRDITNRKYIPGIVPNRLKQDLIINIMRKTYAKLDFNIEQESAFVQNLVEPESDFAPPPPTYTLWNFHLKYELITAKSGTWLIQAGSTNLLNTRYRNYMNRFRYFSDETGRNIFVRIQYNF